MLRAVVLVLSVFVAQAAERPQAEPPAHYVFTWVTNGTHRVLVDGLGLRLADQSERGDFGKILQVHVEPPELRSAVGLPPINGKYALTPEGLEFRPQFPFAAGVRYRATLYPPSGKAVSSVFEIKQPGLAPSTVVKEIYPTAGVLPENLLKFYLHFSAPMSGGHIYDHIQLTDELDEPVELPFLEIDEELWNADMTRLTLFLDPGRIKRGVKPLEEVGPALEENKRYTLTVGSSWLDSSGTPLKEAFQKTFRVTAADRDPPDVAQWKINTPRAGSRDALRVEFTDSMDHALALRMIRVENVDGDSQLSAQEKIWSFTPDKPWSPGKHRLLVQTTIEDLAGNNVGKPFEVDLFTGVQKRITREIAVREFEIQ